MKVTPQITADPPTGLPCHHQRTARRAAWNQVIRPHQTRGASERGRNRGDQHQLHAQWIERARDATERACHVIRQAADRIIIRASMRPRRHGARQHPRDAVISRRSGQRHRHADQGQMRQSGDHLIPVAEARQTGQHEVSGRGQQIQRAQQPEKIAPVRRAFPRDAASAGSPTAMFTSVPAASTQWSARIDDR